MKAYTKPENLREAMSQTNQRYDNNLTFNRFDVKKNHVVFTLRVESSAGPGHRIGQSGRRLVAACWHAHRDFMKALFNIDPDCRLLSAMATYQNQADFEYQYPQTGDNNIGSMVNPVYYRQACCCS